jgi:hypothetical protein
MMVTVACATWTIKKNVLQPCLLLHASVLSCLMAWSFTVSVPHPHLVSLRQAVPAPRYWFTFREFVVDVPFTGFTLKLEEPWTYVLFSGSVATYLLLLSRWNKVRPGWSCRGHGGLGALALLLLEACFSAPPAALRQQTAQGALSAGPRPFLHCPLPLAFLLAHLHVLSEVCGWSPCLRGSHPPPSLLPPSPNWQFKPANVNKVATVHFTALCLYSLLCCTATLYYIWAAGETEASGWLDFMCTPVPSWLRLLSISFTVSKVWEVSAGPGPRGPTVAGPARAAVHRSLSSRV